MKRRNFFKTACGLAAAGPAALLLGTVAGERPPLPAGIRVLNPKNRTPLSLIIDDSTCLVNMAHFAVPQFAEVFPDQYLQDWRALPREIPDAFVRRFGEWCHGHGVKGKFSIVPYPACTGWIDRFIPGWTKRELDRSLDLVRTLMVPDWDIHPEMVSHTWAVDTKTGRPYPERTERFQENWGYSEGKSADELAVYLAYALRILKNAGLPCEGITTPGGFGSQVLAELARATLESCRAVYAAEIPHYFRHAFEAGGESVAPRVEYASDLEGPDPRCVVSIIGCTGDWFGNWDGLQAGSADRFIAQDAKSGRLADVLRRGEPAVLVCHWPGIYFNGEETGFRIFQEVVRRLHSGFSNLMWMKLSEISRYWAAKELTRIERRGNAVRLQAPFACPCYTFQLDERIPSDPAWSCGRETAPFRRTANVLKLDRGRWFDDGRKAILCFDLAKGENWVRW